MPEQEWETKIYEVLTWEEGLDAAVYTEWPTYTTRFLHTKNLSDILNKGWLPVSRQTLNVWFFWERTTWVFIRERTVKWRGTPGGSRSGRLIPLSTPDGEADE